jgi:hypothetical protein
MLMVAGSTNKRRAAGRIWYQKKSAGRRRMARFDYKLGKTSIPLRGGSPSNVAKAGAAWRRHGDSTFNGKAGQFQAILKVSKA